jgi:hypothetical protein
VTAVDWTFYEPAPGCPPPFVRAVLAEGRYQAEVGADAGRWHYAVTRYTDDRRELDGRQTVIARGAEASLEAAMFRCREAVESGETAVAWRGWVGPRPWRRWRWPWSRRQDPPSYVE